MAHPKRRARLNQPDTFPLVSEEHAAAIGYVALRWSAVENAIKQLLAILLQIEGPASHAITAETNQIALLNSITSLVRLTGSPSINNAWDDLANRHDKLRPLRNEAVHAEWIVSGGNHLAYRIKARGVLTFAVRPVPTNELNKLADDALILAEDIMHFGVKVLLTGAPQAIVSAHPPGLLPISKARPRSQAPNPTPQGKKLRTRKLSSAQKRALHEKGTPPS